MFKRRQQRLLLVIQTGARFTVMDQDVTHELHLPLLETSEQIITVLSS